jgi:DNA-binding response OmpR family regulator
MLIDMSLRKRRTDAARRTALIVEDDPRLQRAMTHHFERMDFHVLSASHYDAAVRHLTSGEPHIVCVDVRLPNKSGYELCEHIRDSLGFVGLPIIMTSEYGSPGDMAFAEDAGGNAFLRKPFSMRQLTRCVESLLNAPRRRWPPIRQLQALGPKPISAGRLSRINAPSVQAVSAA